MSVRVGLLAALVLVVHACGGDAFSGGSGGTGGASGGSAGSGGAGGGGSGGGGAGGVAGSAGGSGGVAGSGGGGAGGVAGSGGASGDSSVGGSAGDASGEGSAGDSGTDGGMDADADAGPQAIAVVQATPVKLSMAPAQQVSTLTLSTAPKAGNSLIVGVTCISDYGVIVGDGGVNGDCLMPSGSVTDNQGNTYSQVVQGSPIKSSQQAARGYIFIAQAIGAPTGSLTITVDPEGTSGVQGIAWGAIEVAGLSAPSSVDVTGYTASANGTSTTATTFQATTQANELAVAVLSIRHNDVNAAIVHAGTWVQHQIHQDSVNGPPAHSMVSKVLTSTGTASHTWTHAPPSRGAAGIIATFKGAATN